jgi:hypothetical protein
MQDIGMWIILGSIVALWVCAVVFEQVDHPPPSRGR